MPKAPDGVDPAELNVAARRVLLDALDALKAHHDALVLVGGQAVQQHLQRAGLGGAAAAVTSDGDLGVEPTRVGANPKIEKAMLEAGFHLRIGPDGSRQRGLWQRAVLIGGQPADVEVDLLVPAALAPNPGKKNARIPPHGLYATHKVPGLEAATVDTVRMELASLDPETDGRTVTIRVAGAAALMIAKSYKIYERIDDPVAERRKVAKDAADVVRLMQAVRAETVAAAMAQLRTDPTVGDSSRTGIRYLDELFGRAGGRGIDLATEALAGSIATRTVRALPPAYLGRLRSVEADAKLT